MLRDYQAIALKELYDALRIHRKVILTQPTGSGKSIIAIRMMHAALKNNRRVCVITDRKTLKDQMAAHCDTNGIQYGVISGDDPRYQWGAPIQICTIQTLRNRKDIDHGFGFDLFIVDECHIWFRYLRVLMDFYRDSKFVGLSATPYTANLGLNWDHLVKGPSVRELIDQGYLCDYQVFAPPAGQINRQGAKLIGGEFAGKEIYDRANKEKLYANIVSEYLSRGTGKRALVFAINIAHSKMLCERFRHAGIESRHIDAYSDDQDTRDSIAAFRDGKITVLSSVSKLAVGFDAPEAEIGIIARPTNSVMLHYQMLGRLLRPAPGKDKAIILDHAGNIEELGLPDNPPDLPLDTKNVSDRKLSRPKVKICSNCGSPRKGLKCGVCGHEVKPKVSDIIEKVGQLEEIALTKKRKHEFMAMLKYYEIEKGYQNGWSIFVYRNKFKEEPEQKWIRKTIPPDEEVKRWIKHIQIKRARSLGKSTQN